MRKVLWEHFCVDAFNQSQFAISDSDSRWRQSDAEAAMCWLSKIALKIP